MPHTRYTPHPRLASAMLATTLLALLAACGAGSGSDTGAVNVAPTVTAAPTVAPPTATPNPRAGIQPTIASFCQAVHDGRYNKAFALLSAHYHQLVTTPSQVPNVVYQFGKLTNCVEFGEGNFIEVSGSQASDKLTMTVLSPQFGNLITIPGNITLVRSGSSWLIDAITA